MSRPERLRLGISSCLLGQRVRYDGNHKHDHFITGTLGRHFEFVPVCPEMAIGLGVPRPPIRLTGDRGAPRAVGVDDPRLDVTHRLDACGRRMGRELDGICGYILKSGSPSCGMERVKIFGGPVAAKKGRGIYAQALMATQPLLPVEEEGRLGEADLRANFIERVFAYRRWQEFEAAGITAAGLVAFHSDHKLALLAHGEPACRALGRLAAGAGRRSVRNLAHDYVRQFMAALAHRATRARHANVLAHLAGHLKKHLDAADRAELRELIEDYRRGRFPLIVPVTLLRHHFRRHPDPHVARQTYLYPHPHEWALRYGA